MASQCVAEPLEQEAQPQQVPANSQPAVQDLQQMDYDFVEQPSQDFFCPVTLELLIEPHLTICCGNHLSQEAANRLQRDGKPCPMCNKPQLATVADLYFKRKVNEIKVHCPHKKSGCEWVGGVNEVKLHPDSCPKRPWRCQYCEFACTYDISSNGHTPKCTKYPVVCPNSCEIVSLPRCDLEAHLIVCPLQPVACEYAEVGCDVKVPRRDLARHMEESQQQHLLSATLLILRITKQTEQNLLQKIEELKQDTGERMEELKRDLASKDLKINEIKQDLFAKDKKLDELKYNLTAKDVKIAELQFQVEKYHKDVQKKNSEIHFLPDFTLIRFTLVGFKESQAKGGDGNWFSERVYSNGGYKLMFTVETNGFDRVRGESMSIVVHVDHDKKELAFPAAFTFHIQLLNQLGDHGHHEMVASRTYPHPVSIRLFDEYVKLTDLEHNADKNTQFLKDNYLHFRVYWKCVP